jgi:hypothetical protein
MEIIYSGLNGIYCHQLILQNGFIRNLRTSGGFMGRFRSVVRSDDNYLKMLVNYIPGEIVAAYIAITGYLFEGGILIYTFIFYFFWILTPIWTYFSISEKTSAQTKSTLDKDVIFQTIISFFAYFVWIYALKDDWFSKIMEILYNPQLAPIILVLFTTLVPFLKMVIDRCFKKQ